MDDRFPTSSPQIYRHHWLAFWKPLSVISLLLVLSIGGFRVYFPVGVILLALALTIGISVYLCWSWHTYTFTPDNRLIRRRGAFGCSTDIISLFGTITPYQIPFLGRLLDVGSVRLRIAGPDEHIRHIANFASFCRQLIEGAQQNSQPSPHVQVIIQLPYGQLEHWPGLPALREHAPILDVPSADHDNTPYTIL